MSTSVQAVAEAFAALMPEGKATRPNPGNPLCYKVSSVNDVAVWLFTDKTPDRIHVSGVYPQDAAKRSLLREGEDDPRLQLNATRPAEDLARKIYRSDFLPQYIELLQKLKVRHSLYLGELRAVEERQEALQRADPALQFEAVGNYLTRTFRTPQLEGVLKLDSVRIVGINNLSLDKARRILAILAEQEQL